MKVSEREINKDTKRKEGEVRINRGEELTHTCPKAQLSPKVCALLTSMWPEVVISFTVTLSKFPHNPLRRPWKKKMTRSLDPLYKKQPMKD